MRTQTLYDKGCMQSQRLYYKVASEANGNERFYMEPKPNINLRNSFLPCCIGFTTLLCIIIMIWFQQTTDRRTTRLRGCEFATDITVNC